MQKSKNILIIIDGPMGAGKTTVSELLKERMDNKTALISLDKIKRMVSKYELDSIIHLELAHELGALMVNFYLKKGIDVIVEKAFTRGEFLESFLKLIREKPRLFIYQIESPHEIRMKRIKEREKKKEKGIPRDRLNEKVARNTAHYSELKYGKAKRFDSSKLNPEEIIGLVLLDISN